MEQQKPNIYKGIVLFISWWLLVIISYVFSGFVLAQLWGYFITPFLKIQPPSIAIAIGITIIAKYLVTGKTVEMPTKEQQQKGGNVKKLFTDLATMFISCAMMWGIGAIVHLFV